MLPIVFLHGWGANADSFAQVSRFFTGAGVQCIFVNFDCNPNREMTLDDYVEVVEQKLIDEKITRCNIVGHSFGCRVAVLLAGRNPHMIDQMVLTGAAGLRARFNLKVWAKIRLYKMFKIGKGSSDYSKLSPTGKHTFQNIIHRDLSREISKLKTPTMLICGKNDKSTPLYMAKRWTRLQKSSILKVYTEAGHFAFLDQPARFITDTYNFMEKK